MKTMIPILLLLLTAAAWFLRDRREAAPWDEMEKEQLRKMLPVLIPLLVLAGVLIAFRLHRGRVRKGREFRRYGQPR